jgi:hypothetical protein
MRAPEDQLFGRVTALPLMPRSEERHLTRVMRNELASTVTSVTPKRSYRYNTLVTDSFTWPKRIIRVGLVWLLHNAIQSNHAVPGCS